MTTVKFPEESNPTDAHIKSYLTGLFGKCGLSKKVTDILFEPTAFFKIKASLTDESCLSRPNNNYYKIIGYTIQYYAVTLYMMKKYPDVRNVGVLTRLRSVIVGREQGEQLPELSIINKLIQEHFPSIVAYSNPIRETDNVHDHHIKAIKESFEGLCGCILVGLWDEGYPVGVCIECAVKVTNHFLDKLPSFSYDKTTGYMKDPFQIYDANTLLVDIYRSIGWNTDGVYRENKKSEHLEVWPGGSSIHLGGTKYLKVEQQPLAIVDIPEGEMGFVVGGGKRKKPWVKALRKKASRTAIEKLMGMGVELRKNVLKGNNPESLFVYPIETKVLGYSKKLVGCTGMDEQKVKDHISQYSGILKNSLSPGSDNEYYEFVGDSLINMLVVMHLVKYAPVYEGNPADFHTAKTENIGTRQLSRIAELSGLAALYQKLPEITYDIDKSAKAPDRRKIMENMLESFYGAVYHTFERVSPSLKLQYLYNMFEGMVCSGCVSEKITFETRNPVTDLKSIYDKLPPFDPLTKSDERPLAWSAGFSGKITTIENGKSVIKTLRLEDPARVFVELKHFDRSRENRTMDVFYINTPRDDRDEANVRYLAVYGWHKRNNDYPELELQNISQNARIVCVIGVYGVYGLNPGELAEVQEIRRFACEKALQVLREKYRWVLRIAEGVMTTKEMRLAQLKIPSKSPQRRRSERQIRRPSQERRELRNQDDSNIQMNSARGTESPGSFGSQTRNYQRPSKQSLGKRSTQERISGPTKERTPERRPEGDRPPRGPFGRTEYRPAQDYQRAAPSRFERPGGISRFERPGGISRFERPASRFERPGGY